MALSTSPFYPASIATPVTQLTNASSTTVPVVLLAAQANAGAKIEKVLITSTDTSARDVNIYVRIGSTNYQIGCVSVPAGAGTVSTTPAIDLMSSYSGLSPSMPLAIDANTNPYFYLDASTALYIMPPVAPTSGKVINFFINAGVY